ncbi:unnamed protein product [Cylindrotheca closterium]|uniref:Crossover junction endonuclease MUS81 n=1 Tax=Cylindrotheca closterium TaxID=2856 RepID=A0AAD2FV63_9STRA|nr:unnamed protein product [Cylindrotheca closterium]
MRMAEVIELSDDSSDDECRQEQVSTVGATNKASKPSHQSQVISLLESSDNESSATLPPQRNNKSTRVQSKRPGSSFSKTYAYLDYSDDSDDDSLSQYQASGLSSKVDCGGGRKRKRNDDSTGQQAFVSPHATATINRVTPVQPLNDINNSRVITQDMMDEPPMSSPSPETLNAHNNTVGDGGSASNTTMNNASHPQTPIEPRRIIANPYTQKKKAPPPLAAATQGSTRTEQVAVVPARITVNPYSRKSPPTTTSGTAALLAPTASPSSLSSSNDHMFPSQLTRRGKTYPDLRAKMALCLWRYARSLAHCSYNRTRFAQAIQKVVALSCLAEYPIRSLQEYILRFQGQSIEAVSVMKQKVKDLLEQLTKGGWETVSTSTNASVTGQYYSIAEACLVACKKRLQPRLMELEQEQASADGGTHSSSLEERLKQKEHFLPLSLLLADIDKRLRPECPSNIARPQDQDNGVKFYEQSSTISAEFHQIKRLCSLSHIKFHKKKGDIVVELLPLGYHIATRLISRVVVYPAPNGWYRRSHHHDHYNAKAPGAHPASYSNPPPCSWSNLVLCMDFREGGGATRVLHQMCNDLDSIQLPYFVASLSIGDYVFFHKDKLLPVLIERKSIEDLAQSIYDGRWQSQKKRMYQGQHVFGYGNAILIYIVEGKQEHHLVTGGFIGSTRFKISLERLNDEIEKLSHDGFEVLRTASPSSTLHELSKWAKTIDQQVETGILKPKYTYEEFREEVSKIPPNTDFSRIAKDHYRQRKERDIAQETIVVVDSSDDDNDDDADDGNKNGSDLPTPQNHHSLAQSVASKPLPSIASVVKRSSSTTAIDIAKEIKQRATTAFPKAEHPDYSKWTRAALVKECLQIGLTKSGSRHDLIQRLQGPRPPTLWIQRKTQGHWVPARPDSSGTALMVALWLLQQEHPTETEGFRKADICKKADKLNISREPFVGGKKSFGQFYDGWSSCTYCRKDPYPLVENRKYHKFRLTREGAFAGLPLAEQLHEWCHIHNTCSCKDM